MEFKNLFKKNLKAAPAPVTPTTIRLSNGVTLRDGTAFSQEEIKKDPAKVMAAIIQQQRTLFSKQIEHWIFARAAAENPFYPIRTQLYDIYDDVTIDGFLTGIIYNQRILPVQNKAFKIKEKSGDFNQEKAALFNFEWFRDFILWGLESKFYGHSLIYLDELAFDGTMSVVKKLELIPRKHVIPEKHLWTINQSDLDGTDYTKAPTSNYMIPIGKDKDLGLLNKATPLVILKKHGWNNWDQFGERFGLPIITVKTASQDARVQGEIQKWLQTLSTGAYGIFPTETEIDIKENRKTDAFQVFSTMIDKVDAELSILFLGQTMTSMNGSSRSQGEVHERVKDEITKADEIFITTLVNERLIPLLRDVHHYPFDEGDVFELDQPEDLQALLKIYTGVNQMGFQLDPDEVSEKFGVKIIGLKQVAPAPPAPGNDPDGSDDPDDPANNPDDNPADDVPEPPAKGGKTQPADNDLSEDDEELKASDLINLHAQIIKLYGGNHVH